ncbi:TetR/AcrR family transcriptional regulator [Yinghuangia sp. ASG 101]|uniref:TetR/AcrR family transcriptional regulator n=1 Tax=Yinghuangia sp. ASG 101 TaxID=2896848 RepID=UPI001E6122D8|nr:TetR/AcrR family transcriptional regulator [Yinghuangia sp. ASG 101]UGQ12652.1 TetR/AcrR family transcriptional regulator [Yinghuangia sp. ASG 101]
MASPRRIGAPDAKNRALLLDATEQLMLDEGYAAVSSRRIAAKAGLKPQLVHYYFRTMDDLFLAVFRRRAEEGSRRQAAALASPHPLRAVWELSTEETHTALTMEFVALANHRKAIRAEIVHQAERVRREQMDALPRLMERYGISSEKIPPAVLAFLMMSVSRMLVMEHAIGMSSAHAETAAFVEDYIRRLERDDTGPADGEAAATPPATAPAAHPAPEATPSPEHPQAPKATGHPEPTTAADSPAERRAEDAAPTLPRV